MDLNTSHLSTSVVTLCFFQHFYYSEAYKIGKKERPPFVEDTGSDKGDLEEDKMVPKELLCPICHSILNDAVVAPCCGDSACDDCMLLYFSIAFSPI